MIPNALIKATAAVADGKLGLGTTKALVVLLAVEAAVDARQNSRVAPWSVKTSVPERRV